MISCRQNKNVEELSEFYSNQISNKELIAEIDFSKSETVLLNDIEKQLNVDLCDHSVFSAKMNFKNTEIIFPAYAIKNCNWNSFSYNKISILINKENQVLIGNKVIKHTDNLENIIIELTNKIRTETERKPIIYLIQWDNSIAPKLIKNRVFKILQAIENYTKEIAKKKYNKDISKLSEQELSELKKEFNGIIGFNDYLKPPPPHTENRK